jgi:hypothetical protein
MPRLPLLPQAAVPGPTQGLYIRDVPGIVKPPLGPVSEWPARRWLPGPRGGRGAGALAVASQNRHGRAAALQASLTRPNPSALPPLPSSQT